MAKSNFVFLDAKGRRWFWVRLGIAVTLVVLLALLIVFIQALYVRPELHLPDSVRTIKIQLKAMEKAAATGEKPQPWMRFQADPHQHRKLPTAGPQSQISAALLEPGDPRSLDSLVHHAANLTHVCPLLMTISGQPAVLRVENDPDVLAALHASKVPLVPVLSNLTNDTWDTDALEGLLRNTPAAQDAFIGHLQQALQDLGAVGVLLDWQGIDPAYSDDLTNFLARLRDALHTQNRQLWLSIPVGDDLRVFDLEKLPAAVDHFVAQLHDKSAEDDPAGPVASQPWFEGWLRTLTAYGDTNQWIISLGAYGYDWNNKTHKTTTISFADAMTRAQRAGVQPVASEAPDYNPGFSYDMDDASHDVWFLDASTFANQLRTATQEECGGIMINRLGNEDPGIWNVLTQKAPDRFSPALLRKLQVLDPQDTISQIGDGEFLRADMTSELGQRTLSTDANGYVRETYNKWPTFPTVTHVGEIRPGRVAITFDDGPDPVWTPQILDILKRYKVHATFFLIGKHAEAYPDLVRRIIHEGHEIGSHTYSHPNLSEENPKEITLELNATQRLLEWISNRSTILFRPPYNADSMPVSPNDVRAVAAATDLGYITVGESIDPEDWARPGADEIYQRVRDGRDGGNIILLHDGGGDRSQTVAALPRILDFLHERGDTVQRAGRLIGLTRQQTMPPLADPVHSGAGLISTMGLFTVRWLEEFLWALMIAASLLTVLRSIAVAWFALRRKDSQAPEITEPISVVIAAYNEEAVIEATLRSVLNTDYAGPLEVVVVDDGSKDATRERALAVAAQDPRVKVLAQANAGKSEALAHGVREASHNILVFLDADTQFQPDTLRNLVQPLGDPEVGAVSGHARVGNLKTWIAKCQSLEYICGFNLDRRAYDHVNAITVVPGAISAFRREAIDEAEGFATDTLAEDTDLTLALHRHGWRVTYTPKAIAWTEAPDTIRALAKQRFRWAFGTMQCLWKHRDLVLSPRFGALGCFSLPSIIFFQIFLIAAVPLVDLLLLISLFSGAGTPFLLYFLAFLACDLFLAMLACRIEGEPLRQAAWIIPMRFVYRPVLSWVIWKAIFQMLRGAWVGWGKLERKGTVMVPATDT